MPIGEISSELLELIDRESYFELLPFDDDVFTSDRHDVAIQDTESGFHVEVAEPECGRPNLEVVLLRDNTRIREAISTLWESTRARKALISKVMNAICRLNDGKRKPHKPLRMQEIADICNLHVTTVSRVLDNKICLVDSDAIPCRDYLRGTNQN